MSERLCISFKTWWIPAVVVALGQSLAAPGSAEAACGDYVMIGGHAGDGSHATPVAGEAGVQNPSSPAPQRGPCSGPHCRGEAPRPFGVPVPALKIVVRHWGMLSIATAPVTCRVEYAGFEDDSRWAPIFVSSLFRPPR